MRYLLNLEHTMSATVEVEAESRAEAIREWYEGEVEDEPELDEEMYGGVPWELRRIKEVE